MLSTIASLALAVALSAPGGLFRHADGQPVRVHDVPLPSSYPYVKHPPHHCQDPGCARCGRIMPPGPGYGWGFPNGSPDGYGWVDYGDRLPLGGDRTPEYFFQRHFATAPQLMFFPTYYNPYLQRGQRYVPYAGCGGAHPFGCGPTGSAYTPPSMASTFARDEPVEQPPVFQGRVEVSPLGGRDRGPSQLAPRTLPPMSGPEDALNPR